MRRILLFGRAFARFSLFYSHALAVQHLSIFGHFFLRCATEAESSRVGMLEGPLSERREYIHLWAAQAEFVL